MKKNIEFNLSKNDRLFLNIKQELKELGELGLAGSFKLTEEINEKIVLGSLNAFKALTGKSNNESVKYQYTQTEDCWPSFYQELDEGIDLALNRRVHTATLESICRIVINCVNDLADKQNEKNIKINVDDELIHLINYIKKTWEGFDEKIENLISNSWVYSLNITKNAFPQYDLEITNILGRIYDKRREYKNWDINMPIEEFMIKKEEDAIINLRYHYSLKSSHLYDLIISEFDYCAHAKIMTNEAKKDFEFATKMRPIGWKKFGKNYTDYDGMDGLNEKEMGFEGTKIRSAAALPFSLRVSLPHVMYDDKNQGRKPLDVLIGAILTHAYDINSRNNIIDIKNEWENLEEELNDKKYFKNIMTDFGFNFTVPYNQAICELINNKDEKEAENNALKILGLSVKKKKIKP